ncbi:HTH-type transcriptional repressor NicS [Shimia sp. SK013]|uniref:TetR/AcrR family transcriptional regulator n=1 Tax=Shimia sp. SK013 TaxID=1389006 RepID=UPI0006B567B5|nr:TetR/AcrR family transcriptional regulator [Shimia sp. SK013]KPA21932.1 HTH-type transcriptional repressor NicS [Shimia sp. SK013]
MARTIAKDHDQKRSHILDTAAKKFATEGYDRVSMTKLAEACGVSKATIYHYYTSKEAILFDALDTYLCDLRDRICGLDVTFEAPEEALYHVVREILTAYEGSDEIHRVQATNLANLSPKQQAILKAYQQDLVQFMSDVVERNAKEMFAQDQVKLRGITMSIFGMLNSYYIWEHAATREEREAYALLVTDILLRGVRGL